MMSKERELLETKAELVYLDQMGRILKSLNGRGYKCKVDLEHFIPYSLEGHCLFPGAMVVSLSEALEELEQRKSILEVRLLDLEHDKY